MSEVGSGHETGRKRPYMTGETPPTYGVKEKKSRVWLYVGIGGALLTILAIGTCGWGVSNMLAMGTERAEASQILIAEVSRDGLPAASDQIYHSEFETSQSDIDDLNAFMESYGAPVEIGESACSVFMGASTTESQNGTRAECITPVSYDATNGRIDIVWRMENEAWKLYYFHARYDAAI